MKGEKERGSHNRLPQTTSMSCRVPPLKVTGIHCLRLIITFLPLSINMMIERYYYVYFKAIQVFKVVGVPQAIIVQDDGFRRVYRRGSIKAISNSGQVCFKGYTATIEKQCNSK